MTSKTIIFVLVQVQKVIFCKKRFLFFFVCLLGISIWRTVYLMLTNDSLGNDRAIEKVAMFLSSVVLYRRFWRARPSMG